MESDKSKHLTKTGPDTVLHESNLTTTQKPSFQYMLSVTVGVSVIILLASIAYFGLIQ